MAKKLSKVCRPLFQLCRTLSQYSHNILVSDCQWSKSKQCLHRGCRQCTVGKRKPGGHYGFSHLKHLWSVFMMLLWKMWIFPPTFSNKESVCNCSFGAVSDLACIWRTRSARPMVDEVLQPVLQKARSSSSSSSSSCVLFHLPATPTMLYVSTQQFAQITHTTLILTLTMTLPMNKSARKTFSWQVNISLGSWVISIISSLKHNAHLTLIIWYDLTSHQSPWSNPNTHPVLCHC